MDMVFAPPRWAVPGLLPEGLSLLVGAPKVGKSWLAYGLAAAVASGGVAMGKVDVTAGPVLYCALEDTPRRLQQRLTKLIKPGESVPANLDLWTELEDTTHIDRWCSANSDARLVIIDVLARVRGTSDSRTSLYEQDYAVVCGLKAIADRHGLAVLVLHHDRKAGSDDFINTVSGTHGLAGAADGILVLQRTRTAADAVLKVTGRDVEEAEHALRFDADLGAWALLEGPAGEYGLSDQRRRVLDLVRSEVAIAPKRAADQLGIEQANARQLLKRMAEAGQLDTDGQGSYFMPSVPLSHQSQLSRQDENRDTSDRCDTHVEGWSA
jgi:hypothetical protein